MTPSRNRRRRLARTQAAVQKSNRRLHHETLERRELLAADIGGQVQEPASLFGPAPQATASQPSWQPLGPFSATNGQVESIEPDNEVVGSIHTVLAHPNDADVLYIGAANGGIWRTDNATDTRPNWTPLTDELPSQSIGALTFDRADASFQTIYAGSGRYSSFGRIGGDRIGVLRTTDGGANWDVLDGNGFLAGKNISGVYANGNTIVVSVNTATPFNASSTGIFRSIDGGASFAQVSVGNGNGPTGLPAGVSYDLASDPVNPNVLYTSMAFSDRFGSGRVGIYKSTNQGASWSRVSSPAIETLIDNGTTNNTGTSNIEIAVGRSDNVYAAIVNTGRLDGLFRSGNGGVTWTQMETPSTNEGGTDFGLNPRGSKGPLVGAPLEDIAGGQGGIHFSILADPNDPNVVYVGGDRQPRANESGGGGPSFPNSIGARNFTGRLFRGDASQPIGSQFVHITHSNTLGAAGGGTASRSAPHADSREMVFDAGGDLIEVDDGGVYRRTAPNSNQGDWFSINGDLQVTEAHDVAWDSVSNVSITGNQDTGTTQQPFEGALIWESVSTADGGDVAVDDISLAASGQSIRYSSFQNLGAFRKRSYDASGGLISQSFPNLNVTGGGDALQPAFSTPVEVNTVDPNRLIIQGSNAAYETFDQGETLVQIPVAGNLSSGNRSVQQNAIVAGGLLNGVPNDDLLWVGSGNNVLVRTNAAGSLRRPSSQPPLGLIRDIAADVDDFGRVFVADNNQVVASTNLGTTWTDITGDLLGKVSNLWSLSYVTGPLIDAIVVGTNLGIFASEASSPGTWKPLGIDFPNVPVFDMEWDPQDDVLVAGTLGRGAWLLDNASSAITTAILGADVLDGPNLIAVRPDAGPLLLDGDTLHVAPREFNLLFEGSADLDESTINRNTVKLIRSGGDNQFGNGNDIEVEIGYVGFVEPGATDPADRTQIVLRPASSASFNSNDATNAFPDDSYQILIVGSGNAPLTNQFGIAFNEGIDVIRSFELDRGAQAVAVDPQPISRSSQRVDLGGASGGTFVLSLAGQSTSPIAFDASDASIVAAIESLPNVQTGDVVAEGNGVFRFEGQFGGEEAPVLDVDGGGLTGGAATITRLTSLSQASNQVVIYLDDQKLDPTQAIDPAFYRLVETSATKAERDDRTILPERVTYDSSTNKVVLFFAEDIPEGNFRLDVGSSGGDNTSLETAVRVGTLFNDSEYSKNAFLGDNGGSSSDSTDVDLYQTVLESGTTMNVSVAPQSSTLDTLVRILDHNGVQLSSANTGAGTVTNISYFAATSNPVYVEVSSFDGSTGSYLIDLSVTGHSVSASDANSSLATATQLGSLGAANLTISSSIQPQSIPLPPRAGSEDEPGHRQIQREQHIDSLGTTPAFPSATVIRQYFFPDILGVDLSGNPYPNLITETEKNIVRDIYEIYAQNSGYEFVESEIGNGIAVGKGDLRAIDPSLGPDSGVAGIANSGSVTLNGAIYNQANRAYGDGFTDVMFHEVGHAIGLDHSYDIPSVQGQGVLNDVLPGDHDIVHLQRIVPANSTDIDMYRFDVSESGRFRAETIAERLATPSLLNTVLRLYRETTSGDAELVAQNDQYFGSDSSVDIELEPGTYFIGVTSTGNAQYDPRIADSGFGGTTDGVYDLQIRFDANRGGTLLDAQGTEFDGDADGSPGGIHSFWFQSNDPASTIYVDKLADVTPGLDGNGQITSPFDTISQALEQAGNRIVVPADAANSIATGEQFAINDGTNTAVFTFGTSGQNPIDINAASNAADVVDAIESAIGNAITSGRLAASVTMSSTGRAIQLGGIDNLNISSSASLIATPNLVRIVGNAGDDADLDTLLDNRPYLVGIDQSGQPLPDGAEFLVPQGVTVMIHAGALLKMRTSNIDAGSSSDVDRSASSIQVLGTPNHSVYLRSFHDDSVGGNSDGFGPGATPSDYGGIVFRDDSDLEENGLFLNHVNHADIRHAGGSVFVNSTRSVYSPVHIIDARPTISFNKIADSADSAISASPDSFDDTDGRIGPDILGNFLVNNTFDALFIRVETNLGSTINKLNVNGRLDDTDITHILTENLIINSGSGGPIINTSGALVARPSGRLTIDPGTIVKLSDARIETERGAGTLIAEGTANRPIIFTSIADDRYGGSGDFDADGAVGLTPSPGDWGGLFFGEATFGSIDNALIQYGGGITPIEGGAASFNAIEIHQADVRLTQSIVQFSASGNATDARNGRGENTAAAIYVRGSQPIFVDNIVSDNAGSAISINANSLNFPILRDPGRSTDVAAAYSQFDDNHGPLVRGNRFEDNSINGMVVRGEFLTTESIWDDTDIVHVLQDEITVGNLHTYGGLTLQSSNSESLVVKLAGNDAGFTATGTPKEIIDRVGGTVHVLGRIGHPVVLTSLSDDTIGAGYTPDGDVNTNTNNSATPSTGNSGGWRGLVFDEFSNDRNVAIIHETEVSLTNGVDVNPTPTDSQQLGTLAPDLKSGDENRRLGFVVKGFISPNDPTDVDVYSFQATAGTPIWLDIDRTDTALDSIVEVLSSSGAVLARSVRSLDPGFVGNLNAATLTQNPLLGGDHYTQNFMDPGLFFVPPGTPGSNTTVFVRVRSNPTPTGNLTALEGQSRGEYQLQVRLDQVQEFPGSTVQFADIRFAQTGIDVRGLPARSPLVGEAGELSEANLQNDTAESPNVNDSFARALTLINLLESDVAAISVSGSITPREAVTDEEGNIVIPAVDDDIDWYSFDVMQTEVQEIPGVNDAAGTVSIVLDIDYADGAVRADTTIAVFDEDQNLIFVSRESNIEDDQPLDVSGNIDDLSRGTLGKKDPYIGPIHVVSDATYYVAVISDHLLPSALTGAYQATPTTLGNELVRLEPVNSVQRVVEDHIGFQGYNSRGLRVAPDHVSGLFDITSASGVSASVTPFTLEDVALYVATDTAAPTGDQLVTANPFASEPFLTQVTPDNSQLINGANDIQDIVIRSDGRMFGYQRLDNDTANAGALVELDPSNIATIISTQNDNIGGGGGTPNVSQLDPQLGSTEELADSFAATDDVDAFTFERLGTTGPAAAPVPVYQTYYSVRESDSSSKLYRGDATGDATARGATAQNPQYGFVGNIQSSSVTFAELILSVSDAAMPPDRTDIRIKSKAPGTFGNSIEINITRPNNANANVVSVVGSTINLAIGGTGMPITAGPTAAEIVDAINNDADASQLVSATIVGGNGNNGSGANGTNAIGLALSNGMNPVGSHMLEGGSDDSLNAPVRGRVTGLSFGNFNANGNLFGVSSGGNFIEINTTNGNVVRQLDVNAALATLGLPDAEFEGLALGPQNAENGNYATTLFAVTSDGSLFAFESAAMAGVTDGADPTQVLSVMRQVFDSDGDDIADSYRAQIGGVGSAIGLAFSPLDFNLFHPTLKRAGDAGHGINATPDGTRDPNSEDVTTASPGDVDRESNQGEGGASFHFGFEQWIANPGRDTDSYLTYDPAINAQFGILNTDFHSDLSSNPAIQGTYNFPAGAFGSLTTDAFSLVGSDESDRPTLYFNYFLDTENHGGSNSASDQNDPFRDSARVFASRDNGATWELVATNNSQLSAADPTDTNGTAELPGFLSHLSDAGLNSGTPRAESNQIVQELFDSTGQWRQARVDLSSFAGETNIQLRVDFSAAGAMGDGSLGSIDTNFGELTSDNRSIRSLANAFEGLYIDDIIVGYSERGEMVTGTTPDASITDLFENGRTRDADPNQFADILSGRYQLEIRRTESEYIFPNREGDLFVSNTFSTNERHINEPFGAPNSTGLLADRNRERVQGIFIIDSNFITDSSVRGINVQPGTPQAGGAVPHAGSTINFPQLNNQDLVPGVVIENNVIAGSSGIRFAGETNGDSQRPVPFGRIVNNTLVGDNNTGFGIDVVGRSSPTLLNNLITDFSRGVNDNGIGTIIRSNFFQDNNNHGSTGTAAIIAANGEPLFVDAANGNYYLQAGSQAIDSSQNTEQDRFRFLTFKTELGIPASPIIAPDDDVYGQLRVDSGATGGGAGSTVFKDRGAVDRADENAPFAVLLNPVDNDIAGQDRDPADTIVSLTDQLLENFTILLNDGRGPNAPFEGTGVDARTVSDPSDPSVAMNSIAVTENGRLLQQGIDYTVGYNAITGVLLLTPFSSLWNPQSVYVIALNNDVIADRAGNLLRNNQTDGSTQFTIIMPQVDIDYGDSPDTYRTLLANDGARHTSVNDNSPRIGRFVDGEVDSAGVNSDDESATISFDSNIDTPADTGPFAFSGSTLTLSGTPVSRDNVLISVGEVDSIFEFLSDVDVNAGVQVAAGRVEVVFITGESAEEMAQRLNDSIRAHFAAENLPATTIYDSMAAPLDISVRGLDDEDGVPVGSFTGATTTNGLFLDIGNAELDAQNQPTTSDTTYVVSYVNIADASGSIIDIPIVGDGILDAWLDYNRDGVFESHEKIIDGAVVTDGNNRFRIFSHAPSLNASAGLTWARFRVSSVGIETPYGLANDGEVEDHQVQIFDIELPTLVNDSFTVNEDAIPASGGSDAFSLSSNDVLPTEEFILPEYILDLPQIPNDPLNPNQDNKFKSANGVVTLLDPSSGLIDYQPDADFHGTDTFRYRVTTQRNDGPGEAAPVFATVTFTVNPINDAPLAADKINDDAFATPEDTPLLIVDPNDPSTLAELTGGALLDGDPLYPTFPFDETNQVLNVVAITADGGSISTTGSVRTLYGELFATFDTTSGFLTELSYVPDTDFNSINLPDTASPFASTIFSDPEKRRLDTFDFTIRDDGLSVQPTSQGTPLESTGTAQIVVTPQNDNPIAVTDLVSNESQIYRDYFTNLSLPVPVPTEDTTFVFPAAFLLDNDLVAHAAADDELQNITLGGTGIDGTVLVTGVSLLPAYADRGVISLSPDGTMITFEPSADIYGTVRFQYDIVDQGRSEGSDGTIADDPLTASVTSTIFVEPVNDEPKVFDRAMTFTEIVEVAPVPPPSLTFDYADLINGAAGETPVESGGSGNVPFDESEQFSTLEIVEFADADEVVNVSSLAGGTGTLTMTSDEGGLLTFNFVGGNFTDGSYVPRVDYTQDTPFNPVDTFTYRVLDDGSTTLPEGGTKDQPPALSPPGTVAISVEPSNDAPAFPAGFDFNPFILEVEPRVIPFTSIDLAPGFGQRITPGPLTAMDELDEVNRQTTRIELIPVNVPGGTPADPYGPNSMITQQPTLSADGILRLVPRPDAFGVAVFDIQVTDTLPDGSPLPGSLTTTERLTITFEGTNDVPVAQDYTRTVTEAVEGLGESTSDPAFQIAFTATDLLDIGGPRSAVAHLRNGIVPDLFNESQQQLDVVEFLVPNPAGGADLVVNSSVTELITPTGGKLSFTFNLDVFVSGIYEPAIDYNDTTPYFAAPEVFQYIIRDSGPIDMPGTDFINSPGPADQINLFMERSAPASITFNVTPRNDSPFIPAFADIPIQTEFEPVGTSSFTFDLLTNAADIITPGPLTALDELDQQSVVISVAPHNVPGSVPNTYGANSLLMREPTLTPDGILTVFPTPEAYGVAVLEVQVSDVAADGSPLADSLTSTQLITITVEGVNDQPVAHDREFTVPEAVESLGQSTSDPAYQIRFTKADLLRRDLIADRNAPEPAYTHTEQGNIDTTFDEHEQELKIVSVADGNEFIQANVDGVRTMTTASGGTINFTFAGGELIEGVYIPAPDFNQNTPFATDDIFTFIVEDSGSITNPGAAFANDPAIPTSIDLGTLASEQATVTLTVLAVNDPPIFSGANNILVDEDAGPRVIANWATGIQAGPPGASDELQDPPAELEFELTLVTGDPSLFRTPPTTQITGSDATLSFETAPDRNGVAVYEVLLREINGPNNPANGDSPVSEKQTFTITVNPINDPPTFIAGDVVTVDEDSAAYRAIWATDISTGPAEEPTTQTIDRFDLTLPAGAANLFTVQPSIDIDGTLSFAPANDAAGTVMIDVAAVDSEGLSSELQTLTIRIVDFDDSPVPVNDELTSNEDDILVIESVDLLRNDIDPDLLTNPNEVLSVVLPPQLTTTLGATVTFDNTTGQITYDPTTSQTLQEMAPGDTLVDRFIYSVTDADEEDPLPTAEVILTIDGRNDAPIPGDDVLSVSPDATTILSPLVNDIDVDGQIDPASIIVTEQPTQGSLSIESNGTLLYTPGINFSGLDSFRYTVGDNLGQQSEQATINVSASGAPSANDDAAGTFMGGPVDIDVLSNDSTNAGTLDPATVMITTPPTNGTAVPQADGSIRYTPNPNYTGPDTFGYTVADTSGRISNASTVDVNVVESNLQNPRDSMDVNASGTVTSLDALLVINRLSRAGNNPTIPVESPDRGPNFYDVSGDLNISATDALRVINFLSRQGAESEGELTVDPASFASVVAAPEPIESGQQVGDPPATTFAEAADKVIATSRLDPAPHELIDMIAQEQNQDDDDDRLDAVDAAIESLL